MTTDGGEEKMTDTRGDAQRNMRFGFIFGGVALLMIGMAYAAVPLYEIFCQVTGYGGTTQRVEDIDVAAIDRKIKIRFNGSLHRDMPWGFEPMQTGQEIKIGEQALAFYEAHNPTKEAVWGTATYNVTPHKAGPYFSKIDCFCFTEQLLKPGEKKEMPVLYFVDPLIVEDPDMADVTEITLSYTFFRMDDEDKAREKAYQDSLAGEE